MSYTTDFLFSLLVTLIVEVPIVVCLVKILKEKTTISRIIWISILATTLTIPYLWFVFNEYFDYWTMVILGEIFVFIVEAIIYWKLLPVSFKKAIIISFLANISSILLGLLIGLIF